MSARHVRRPHRPRRWIRNAVVAIVLGLVGLGAAAVLSGSYEVRPVLSGSMRPGLPVGGIVITKRVPISSLRVRDVVVLHPPDEPNEFVVHRIISITPGPAGPVVQTRGDANNVADPWQVTLRGASAYRVVYSVPLVGYAAVWVHNPQGRRTLLLLGLLMLLGAAAAAVVARRRGTASGGEAVDRLPDVRNPVGAVPDAHADLRFDRAGVGEPEPSAT